MEFAVSISHEEMAQLPIRRYEGEVRLVESLEALEREAAAIGRERVLGFDTETRPAFRKGESYPPALVQLAGEAVVWIFRLQLVDCSVVLKHVMESDAVKAGIGVADDLRQLKKMFAFEEASVLDVGERTSNWAAARLTRQQIGYAALDAWAARTLYLKLAA